MAAAFKQWVLQLQPRYAVEQPAPFEPEQEWLLGNRWADYGLACLVAFIFPVVRGLLRTHIYEPLGRSIIFGATASTKLTGKQQDRLKKWNESAWKMTVFSFMSGVAFWVSVGEPWFWETRYFWLGCNQFPPCNLSVSKGVLLFYAIETGFYAQSIHFLLFHETRRKDWTESMVHHIATLALLVYSYWVNFTRVGVMIMLVHDISDIFLEGAKLARYARVQSLAVAVFAMFAVIWVITRNGIFPFVLIRSTLTEPLYYAAIHKIEPEPHYTIFNSLLVLLEVLHIYWTYLIFKIVYKQLTQGEAKDIREEDDDDD